MKSNFLILASALLLSAFSVACSDDAKTTADAGTPFTPPKDGGGSIVTPDGGSVTPNPDGGSVTPNPDGGGPTNCGKPAGCFCGTPTTQKQWLNRCTDSVALPFNTVFKAGTTADLP